MVNGVKIKTLMNERGISNKEMANTIGVSEAMMTYITQELKDPNVKVLSRIAKKLDCTVDELINQ